MYTLGNHYISQEPRNDLPRNYPQKIWQTLYKDVIADLRESKRLIEEDELIPAEKKTTMFAQLEIVEVYAWSLLVNTFGNVPYSESMDFQNPVPVYDDAATIYSDILNRLNIALGSIADGSTGFEAADILYDGDTDQWIKFGNSLKLKLAMVLADVDNGKAKQLVEEAAAISLPATQTTRVSRTLTHLQTTIRCPLILIRISLRGRTTWWRAPSSTI